jgi:hypothetical protein
MVSNGLIAIDKEALHVDGNHNRNVSRCSLSAPTPKEAFLCTDRQTKAAISLSPPHVIRCAARPNTFPTVHQR